WRARPPCRPSAVVAGAPDVDAPPRVDEHGDAQAVDRLLDAAGKRGRAVTGLESTIEAVNRDAVQQLYLLPGFKHMGAVCQCCGRPPPWTISGRCRFCDGVVRPAELGDAMGSRVLGSGGWVGLIDRHTELDADGGVGAILRCAA